MVLKLVEEDDVRYNKERYTIKCRMCGSYETKTNVNRDPIWIKDKNSKREWTNQFLCYKCAYERNKLCYKCESYIDKYMTKYYDSKGIWTGRYICDCCRYKDIEECRNRKIELKIGAGNGSIEDIIISKILEIPACSIYFGDLRLPFGLIHGYYGIVGVKIAKYNNGRWDFCSNGRISADTYFYLGFSKDYKNIEIVYIVPSEELIHTNGRLYVHKNSKKYLKYKVDEKPYNDIYHNICTNTSMDTKNTDINVENTICNMIKN